VATVFEPQLSYCAERQHPIIVNLLVVATDVYTWKILRRDRRLSRKHAEEQMRYLTDAILASAKQKD